MKEQEERDLGKIIGSFDNYIAHPYQLADHLWERSYRHVEQTPDDDIKAGKVKSFDSADGVINYLRSETPEPIPDGKLREQIDNILSHDSLMCSNPTAVGLDDCGYESGSPHCHDCQIKQFEALIQPEIDKAYVDGYILGFEEGKSISTNEAVKAERERIAKEITDKMHGNNWDSLIYFHPGEIRMLDRWVAGTMTGKDNDLVCVKKCNTREDGERYLSPQGNTALEAIDKSIALLQALED